jgi:hypothetical protein
MTRKDHIEQLVDATLSSLDGIQRAQPAPFFRTRLMARLEAGRSSALYRFVGMISRPAFAITIAVVFLLLNGVLLLGLLRLQQGSTVEDPAQSLAYEYTHSTPNNTFYANNPEHP